MSGVVRIAPDPRLRARVIRRTPLHYREGADAEVDRPPYVRAASSLAHVAEVLVVVQDDANFLALVDPVSHEARSVPLPHGPGGKRVFGFETGGHHHKLDLEACVRVPGEREHLIAFGSGSTERREWILDALWEEGEHPRVDLRRAEALYAALRSETGFCGSGLNVEGAVFVDDRTLRLFQRGNAPARDGLEPVDASADLDWPALERHLREPDSAPVPPLENIVHYDLGELHGVRLTFSDAEQVGAATLYSASAEGAPGESAGAALGVIDASGARQAELIDQDGTPFEGKIEGLAVAHDDPMRVHFVLDDDDASQPSPIYEALLEGPWYA